MPQSYYEFSEWKKAFSDFYRRYCDQRVGKQVEPIRGDKSLVLVISTHPDTSGYWIERNPQVDEHTHVYRTEREVRNLEQRVRRRIAKAAGHATGLIL